jgi:hypothetical protein
MSSLTTLTAPTMPSVRLVMPPVRVVMVVSTVRMIGNLGLQVRSGKDQPNRHHDHAATM